MNNYPDQLTMIVDTHDADACTPVIELWLDGVAVPTQGWSHTQWLSHLEQAGWSVTCADAASLPIGVRRVYELRRQPCVS